MKILVSKNTPINITKECSETVSFFSKHNIPLEFTFKDVDVKTNLIVDRVIQGFNAITGKPSLVTYYRLDKPVPLATDYDMTMFVWDFDKALVPSGGVITSFTTSDELMQIAINKYLKDKGEITTRITHEIMHCLCYKASKAGFQNVDEMDKTKDGLAFFKNDTPDAPDGNYARTFKNLQPYLDSLNSVVTITRFSDDGVQTLGDLTYKNFKCKTLERPWKDNKPNISCIPKGTYRAKWTFSPKFLKYTYEILGVPKRSGIRFHAANFWFDLNGCITQGTGYANLNNDKEVDIINSKATVDTFNKIMNKRDFTLVIK